MSMNVMDYVKIYDNFIDPKICKKIISKLKKADWQKHSFYAYSNDSTKSHNDDFYVSTGLDDVRFQIMNNMKSVVEQYIKVEMKDCDQWFNSFHGFTHLRWNKYTKDTNMKLHCDHIHSMFDGRIKGIPTLSILGAINDDYEGGELVFWESETIQLKAGEIMIFPSNFMYPHKVNTITKGTRYSYVSWVW